MDLTALGELIGGILLGVVAGGGTAGGIAWHRREKRRRGRSEPPSDPPSDPEQLDPRALQTGRFARMLRDAPPETLEAFVHSVRQIAQSRPLTRGELPEALREAQEPLRRAVEHNGQRIGTLSEALASLPCMTPAPVEPSSACIVTPPPEPTP